MFKYISDLRVGMNKVRWLLGSDCVWNAKSESVSEDIIQIINNFLKSFTQNNNKIPQVYGEGNDDWVVEIVVKNHQFTPNCSLDVFYVDFRFGYLKPPLPRTRIGLSDRKRRHFVWISDLAPSNPPSLYTESELLENFAETSTVYRKVLPRWVA